MPFTDADSFLDHIATDETLAAEFRAATSEAEVVAILAREQVECSPAEIRDAFLERFADQLDEDQLAAIAGGLDGATIGAAAGVGTGIFIGTAIAVGASAAAAA